MKHRNPSPCSPLPLLLGLGAVAACGGAGAETAPPPQSTGLGGITRSGYVVDLDPATAASEILTKEGLSGFGGLSSLALDSAADRAYSVDNSRGVLVELDLTDGSARAIGPVGHFQLHENLALDEDTGTLYSIDWKGTLYSIDRATGAATQLGLVEANLRCGGLAFDPLARLLYTVEDATGQLLTVDPATASIVAEIGAPTGKKVWSLAFDPLTRTLYGAQRDAATYKVELVAVDPGTGAVTTLAPMSLTAGLALDVDTGRLFGFDQGALAELDPATGKYAGLAPHAHVVRELAFDPETGTLFGLDLMSRGLVRIDPELGTAVRIGPIGLPTPSGLAYDPVARVLYTFEENADVLATIDPETGQGTRLDISLPTQSRVAVDPATGLVFALSSATQEVLLVDVALESVQPISAPAVGYVTDMDYDAAAGMLLVTYRDGADTLRGTVQPFTGGMATAAVATSLEGYALDPATGFVYATTPYGPLLALDPGTDTFRSVGAMWGNQTRSSATYDEVLDVIHAADTQQRLWRIDPASGETTLVRELDVDARFLAADAARGVLFGLQRDGILYELDASTGDVLRQGDLVTALWEAVAFDPDTRTLYASRYGDLYRVDFETHAIQAVGPMGMAFSESLAFDRASGRLFATDRDTRELYSVDPATGAGELVGHAGWELDGLFSR